MTDSVSKIPVTTAVSFFSGLLFGAGMIISEMVNPEVVLAFLDIGGDWDPRLAFVMIGALSVFAPAYHLLIKKRQRALNGVPFSWTSSTKVDGKLIAGAIIFGIGWGLVGFCPGPAIASIGGGTNIVLAFILSMTVGMVLAREFIEAGSLSSSHDKEPASVAMEESR